MKIIRPIFLLIAFCTWGVFAQAAGDEDHTGHPHHVSIFAGLSYDMKYREGIKLGIEYIYRISDPIAIRTALDFTGKDYDELSISAGGDLFPISEVPYYLGVGLGAKYYHEKWNPFVRILTGYDFHVGKLSLSPLIMYDIYELKNYLTFGAALGIGF